MRLHKTCNKNYTVKSLIVTTSCKQNTTIFWVCIELDNQKLTQTNFVVEATKIKKDQLKTPRLYYKVETRRDKSVMRGSGGTTTKGLEGVQHPRRFSILVQQFPLSKVKGQPTSDPFTELWTHGVKWIDVLLLSWTYLLY